MESPETASGGAEAAVRTASARPAPFARKRAVVAVALAHRRDGADGHRAAAARVRRG